MLKNIKKEYINIAHLIVLVPPLLYAGWKGNEIAKDEKDLWVFRSLILLAVLVAVLHGWQLWQRYSRVSKKTESERESDEE